MQHPFDALENIHQKIAQDVYPAGGHLTCRVDPQHNRPFTTDDAGQYFKCGWPTCCGSSMLTNTPPPAEPE